MVGILERDTQGMLKRAIGVIMDIEQKKKNSTKMDSMINAIPGGVAIYKIGDTIKTIYSSEGIPKLSGRTMAEYQQWVDDGVFENTIYIDDRFRVQQAVESAVSTGGDIQVIYRLNHKDGGVVWVQLLANMIGVEDGFPIYYAVYTRIPQETELYKRVVEDSTTAVFIADKQKRTILYANQVWRKIEGIPKDIPIIGRHLFDLIPSVNQIFCEEDLRALPKEEYLEYHRTHINGLYLHIYARSMDWNGIDAYILYISDATKEYTDRQALQRLVDSVPGGIGIYEVFMDRVAPMHLNEGFYRMLGGRVAIPIKEWKY
ncbi:PAS domain-containing protein [Eubacterium aggregans]|uniref:PAS domain-containing protein n=1 Tax=Eubacterium aggregans TaxID=81409 RepID=UPI003F2E63E3